MNFTLAYLVFIFSLSLLDIGLRIGIVASGKELGRSTCTSGLLSFLLFLPVFYMAYKWAVQ